MRMVNIRTVVKKKKVLTFGASARGLLVCYTAGFKRGYSYEYPRTNSSLNVKLDFVLRGLG